MGKLFENVIASEPDVVVARTITKRLAESIGMDVLAKYSVMTAVSELGWNILRHAGTGTIAIRTVHDENGQAGIEVTAVDSGPGIEDIELALQDSYSTIGTLGCGLPAVKRLMSDVVIESGHGEGTRVRAVRWLEHQPTQTLDPPAPASSVRPDLEAVGRGRKS
jgi:serine/threonine-protein kinase RsbT